MSDLLYCSLNGFVLFVDIDECASSPCKNGGMCIDLNAEWTTSSSGFTVGYACQCTAGYTGDQCETSKNFCFVVFVHFYSLSDVDECASSPCQNGGSCGDGINKYTCGCVAGYTGNECETSERNITFMCRFHVSAFLF